MRLTSRQEPTQSGPTSRRNDWDLAAVPLRQALACGALRAVAGLSRATRRGGGSTIGGRVALAIDPKLLAELGARRQIALVSGTNGKTTTTRLLAQALASGRPGPVATSSAGANLPAGLVTALARAAPGAPGVLEVDEGYLPEAIAELAPNVVALLNLSRDQLDRLSEVRRVAARWRAALSTTTAAVVANADDPLVAWAASAAAVTTWVGVGGAWHEDAHHCPCCDAQIEYATSPAVGWSCSCGFARPPLDARLDRGELVLASGERILLDLALPGTFNQANAAIAAIAAARLGVAPARAAAAMRHVREVAGRYAVVELAGMTARLLLAKNPAGWTELLGLLHGETRPVVVGINARVADGKDPSWLWDVPFELLGGRLVVATGERRSDLAVRLRHAGVAPLVEPDARRALTMLGAPQVDFIGNYTAFQDLRRRLRRRSRRPAQPSAPRPEGAARPVVAAVGAPLAPSAATRRPAPRAGASSLRVVVVHPDLLGTYGDSGNGRVLANRALWRDVPVELVLARSDAPLPTSGDLYCLGGGEDGPQVRAAKRLADGALARAVANGAVVFAVCAGFQILGRCFPGPDGGLAAGIGLLDVATRRLVGPRAVGELVVEAGFAPSGGPGLLLTGFENHAGATALGEGVEPLGRVVRGVGNGVGAVDGARAGRIFGTYLHGPALARNPALADHLLALALGEELAPLDDDLEAELRAQRLRAARTRPWATGGRLRRRVVSRR